MDSNASDYIRTLPFGYEPPDILHHSRAYSSDEDGDGPSKACITFKRLVRLIQSLCIVKADLPCHSDDRSSSSVGYANVPPRCDVCGTPCQVYRWCIYCYAGPVMHHGRCCWYNPGRPADKPHRAAGDASDLGFTRGGARTAIARRLRAFHAVVGATAVCQECEEGAARRHHTVGC